MILIPKTSTRSGLLPLDDVLQHRTGSGVNADLVHHGPVLYIEGIPQATAALFGFELLVSDFAGCCFQCDGARLLDAYPSVGRQILPSIGKGRQRRSAKNGEKNSNANRPQDLSHSFNSPDVSFQLPGASYAGSDMT